MYEGSLLICSAHAILQALSLHGKSAILKYNQNEARIFALYVSHTHTKKRTKDPASNFIVVVVSIA